MTTDKIVDSDSLRERLKYLALIQHSNKVDTVDDEFVCQAKTNSRHVEFLAKDMITLFNGLFRASFNTILLGGVSEPLYQPGDKTQPHCIYFTHDYFSSALHEIAHWCIAGTQRRALLDYGYWYSPDGRDQAQQRAFEKAEVKPQAIEMAFSLACAKPFRVSTDNLNGQLEDDQAFAFEVQQQLEAYIEHGFPARAMQFLQALFTYYDKPSLARIKTTSTLLPKHFTQD